MSALWRASPVHLYYSRTVARTPVINIWKGYVWLQVHFTILLGFRVPNDQRVWGRLLLVGTPVCCVLSVQVAQPLVYSVEQTALAILLP